MPPPAHMLATPMPPPRRRSSYTSRDDHAGAGRRDRVTEAAAAAVDVRDLVRRCRGCGTRRRGTDANASLISNEVDVARPSCRRGRAPSGSRRSGRGRCRAGGHARRRPRHDLRQRLEPVRLARSRSRRAPSRRAPSLRPDELPAVMLKSSISGWSGFSAASFSIVRRRGAGARRPRRSRSSPSRRFTSIGKISSSKRPSSIASTARRCDRTAQSSMSSRVSPAFCAVFQPTVIDMSNAGASGVSGWLGDIHGAKSSVPSDALHRRSARSRCDSAPPAMTTLSMPAMMLRRRALHRGHARRAVPVERDARHLDEAELDRGVAGDVAAALEDSPIWRSSTSSPGMPERFSASPAGLLGEVERGDVEQRALAGGADRRCGRRQR